MMKSLKMFSLMLIAGISVCLSTSLEVAQWRKTITDTEVTEVDELEPTSPQGKNKKPGGTVVTEFAAINEDDEEILMSSSDSCLAGTLYNQSVSLHDFKTGYVALKNFDAEVPTCYLTKVFEGLERTADEVRIRGRQKQTIKNGEEVGRKARQIKRDELESTSLKLTYFCSDVKEVFVLEELTDDDYKLIEGGELVEKESLMCIWIVIIILVLVPTVAY